MFWPPVILAALAAFVGLDVLIIARARLAPDCAQRVGDDLPAGVVPAGACIDLTSAVFHQCEHVSACRYGGAKPGVMALGLYLVWPARYSTVTDSYRLSRAGRLRTISVGCKCGVHRRDEPGRHRPRRRAFGASQACVTSSHPLQMWRLQMWRRCCATAAPRTSPASRRPQSH
jgi:hypothetical protein